MENSPVEVDCILMTDSAQMLTRQWSNKPSDICVSLVFHPSYPDPFLGLKLRCDYHATLPEPEPDDDLSNWVVPADDQLDEMGYKKTHHGWAKLTCRHGATLRILRLERATTSGQSRHGLRPKDFASQLADQHTDVAIAPVQTSFDNRPYQNALDRGELSVIRIELQRGADLIRIGMDTAQVLGECDGEWRHIAKHIAESRSLNLVTKLGRDHLKHFIKTIRQSWREMRPPIQFSKFYTREYVESSLKYALVPRDSRPTDFKSPELFGFMHPQEYNVTLTYGYVDENDHQNVAIEAIKKRSLQCRFLELPNTKGREYLILVKSSDIASVGLKPGDSLLYQVLRPGDTTPTGHSFGDYTERKDVVDAIDAINAELELEEQLYAMKVENLPKECEERTKARRAFREWKQEAFLKKQRLKPLTPLEGTGKVAEDCTWLPDGWKALYAERPFDQLRNDWDHTVIDALPWTSLTSERFGARLEAHSSHRIMLWIPNPNSERTQVLGASHEMWTKKNSMTDLWDLLLMQRPSEFPSVDFYGTIPSDHDFTNLTDGFNRGQTDAFNELRHMKGFVTALHGPPGTGKTYWASHTLAPLVEHNRTDNGDPHRIFALAATNEQADKFAIDLHKHLNEKVHRADKRSIMVIRVLPWHVGESIAQRRNLDQRQKGLESMGSCDSRRIISHDPFNLDPVGDYHPAFHLVHEVLRSSESSVGNKKRQQMESMLVQLRNSTLIPTMGSQDRRVRNSGLHLGTRIAQVLEHDRHRERPNWLDLHAAMDCFRKGDAFSDKRLDQLQEGIMGVRDYVLRSADVIVSIPFAACQKYLREQIKPTHIVIDEASQICEPRLWPVFAWYTHGNNPDFKAMILMGDHFQIPPIVIAPQKVCHFKPQLATSFFYRLIANGLCLPALYQQRRMHFDIAWGPKQTFYRSSDHS